MSSTTFPLQPDSLPHDEEDVDSRPKPETAPVTRATETTPSGKETVQWENVAETMGLLPAQIIAGRLQNEGIPARAWQESLGVVHGLTIGPLGTGHVSVPREFVEQALEILDAEADDLDETEPDHP
jgi:hypothetical protein